MFSVVLWLFGVQDHVFPFQYVSHKRRRRKRRVTAAAGTRRAAHSQGHQSILWSICILAAYSRSGNSSNSFISAHDMGSIWKKRGEMSIWAIGANVHDDDRKLPIRGWQGQKRTTRLLSGFVILADDSTSFDFDSITACCCSTPLEEDKSKEKLVVCCLDIFFLALAAEKKKKKGKKSVDGWLGPFLLILSGPVSYNFIQARCMNKTVKHWRPDLTVALFSCCCFLFFRLLFIL